MLCRVIIFILVITFLILTVYPNRKMNKTFYNVNETYPWLNDLSSKKNFKLILDDLYKIKESITWQEWPEHELWKNNNTNKWTLFPIKAFGKWSNKNIKSCPNIYNLLQNNSDIINIGFSRLSAGTKLDEHQGWANLSNYVLRCHLALIVPGPAYIYCENDKQQQQVGKWIVFDDSKLHYADNMGNDDRIVLILDIKRPGNVKIGESNIVDSKELLGFIKEFELMN
jgi:aspartyl/asparaginyl beta-hydroxylase (cupin superfamily)